MIPIQPTGVYDASNESQFRTQVLLEDGRNLKNNVPIQSFIMIDEADGQPYRVSLNAGVLTFTVVTP